MQSRTRIFLNLLVWIFIALLLLLATRINDVRHWATRHDFSLVLIVVGTIILFLGIFFLRASARPRNKRRLSNHPLERVRS
jgi:hypothetical protein